MKRLLFRNLSIKNKLVLIIISTSMTAIIFGLILTVTYDILTARKELKENALLNTKLIGQYSAAPLIFGYKDEANDVLAKLESIPSIIDACLFEPGSDKPFAEYHKEQNPGNIKFPVYETESIYFSNGYLHVFQQIKYKDQDCGVIYLRISAGIVKERLNNSLLLTALIIILLVIVVSVTANSLQKLISRPILNLANLTRKISENDEYSEKLKYSGNDEINTLYRNFDNMLKQIFERKNERDIAENQLKSLNQKLNMDLEERKRMEKTLRISEERYRYLFENNPVPMIIYDKETFNLIAVNDAFMNKYGYSESEILKMDLMDLYPGKEKAAITDLSMELGDKVYAGEWQNVKKDGSLMTVLSTSHDLVFMGKDARIVVLTDITGLKKAEKEISFLAQVLRNINELVSITDTENNITFVNQSWLKTFEYTEDEVLGKNISIIVSPSNRPGIVKEVLKATNEGGWHGELINRKKNGTEFPVALSTTIIYDDNRIPVALVGISADITEEKKIREELNDHHRNLEKLVQDRTRELNALMKETMDLYENAPCGYHSLDTNGIFVRINRTELNWLGYSGEELINKKGSRDVMTPASREKFGEIFREFLKKGEVRNVEFEYVRKDGSVFFGSLNATAVRDSNGKIIMTRSTLFDITERKKFEAELNTAREVAERASQAKSEFLANMSHEIRTPMNAVLGYTELLSSLLTDQNQKNYIESIRSSGRSLLTLINDILDLSKIEAGKLELEFDYVDSRHFFNEFEKIFELKASEKGIKFLVEISSGTPAGIYVDEPRLRQIIFNLVGNAIKFTTKGFVKLKVRVENHQTIQYQDNKRDEFIDLVIEVEDTGIGISKEVRDEIFEPFIQARDHKTIGGTGLGLAISRRLVTLMKGSLSLDSELHKGSTFTAHIPDVAFKTDFSLSSSVPEIDTSTVIFEKSLILVIDDVEFNRKYISDVLKDTNVQVIEAEDGFRALELLKEKKPDLIISDIRMPVMDGFSLLKRIKSQESLKEIPVLAYSASVLKEQREKIHETEFAGLLSKPVSISSLYTELMNYLPYEKNDTTGILPDAGQQESAEIIDLSVLLSVLETDLIDQWKTFEKRQPIGEVKKFGDSLHLLGVKHNAVIITTYGKDLKNAAEVFDVNNVLKLIRQYPEIIQKLKLSS